MQSYDVRGLAWHVTALDTENEQRIRKDLPILVVCGTRDPVSGMTATARALIERYQQYGVRNVSYIFFEGARHEPLNDFCREQMHADVLGWLDGHLRKTA